MWLYANKGFLSIVEDFHNKERLLVRGRFNGDIEAFFPNAEVLVDVGTDYKYRTFLPREEVVETVKSYMENELNYSNYKNSVKDGRRLSTYHQVWNTMYEAQEKRSRTSV
jgi:hypothetical protein